MKMWIKRDFFYKIPGTENPANRSPKEPTHQIVRSLPSNIIKFPHRKIPRYSVCNNILPVYFFFIYLSTIITLCQPWAPINVCLSGPSATDLIDRPPPPLPVCVYRLPTNLAWHCYRLYLHSLFITYTVTFFFPCLSSNSRDERKTRITSFTNTSAMPTHKCMKRSRWPIGAHANAIVCRRRMTRRTIIFCWSLHSVSVGIGFGEVPCLASIGRSKHLTIRLDLFTTGVCLSIDFRWIWATHRFRGNVLFTVCVWFL